MTDRLRLRWALGLVVLVVLFGTLGFMVIEDLNVVDAFYETIITVSTVGFAEPAGGLSSAGRVFTAVLILMGVGSALYSAVYALEVFIDEMVGGSRYRRREARMIAKLEGHTIVCGYGRVGHSVADRLTAHNVPLAVIDDDDDRIDAAREAGLLVVQGDATDEDILIAAGLDEAGSLIACVHSDSDNLSIVLSARAHRPDLYILARASYTGAERRIKMAGADRVITPNEVGAARLAALVLHPQLTEFVDVAAGDALFEFRVLELEVGAGSELVGKSLAESQIRSRVGASVLAIRHANDTVDSNPSPRIPLQERDVLVAIGTVEQLEQLEKLV